MRALAGFGAGLGLILIAAGCAPPPPPADACGASRYAGLVGQPAGVAQGMVIPAPVRVLEPDTPRTEDYRPDRLNIEIGTGGIVTKVWCG